MALFQSLKRGFALGICVSLLMQGAAFDAVASGGNLNLSVNCVRDNQDGTFTATFGYENRHRDDGYLVIVAQVGEANAFSPGGSDRGQPSSFNYGTHPGVFSVTWDGTPLTWEVRYRYGQYEYTSSVVADSSNQEQRECEIIPYADCIMRDYGRRENGSWYEHYYTYFSIYNPGPEVTVPIGASNAVGHSCYYSGCSPDLSQDQPTTLPTGHRRGIFVVSSLRAGEYGNTGDLYWFIDPSQSGEGRYATASWSYTRECDVFPIRECLQLGCQVPGQKGTKTAWFGFRNTEPFTVSSPTRNYYNSLRPAYGCEYNNFSGYDQFGRPCVYPQPQVFPSGEYRKVFGICFSGNWNGGEEGGDGEDIPIADAGLNNYGRVQWRLGSGWYDYADRHYATVTSESRMCNRAPSCAIENVTVPCAGNVTNVFLNGGSRLDLDGNSLTYKWTHDCATASLHGDTTLYPVLSMKEAGQCGVTLEVREQDTPEGFAGTCSARVEVQSCNEVDGKGCSNRDISGTEYMLASACSAQRRLVESGVSLLRRTRGRAYLSPIVAATRREAVRCRDAAWSLPDVVMDCPESAGCASLTLAASSNAFAASSDRLDAYTRYVQRRLRRAGWSGSAIRHEHDRRALRENIRRLLVSTPKTTSTCS